MRGKLRRRVLVRGGAVVLLVAIAMVLVVRNWRFASAGDRPLFVDGHMVTGTLTTADQSRISLLDTHAEVVVGEDTPSRVEVSVASGRTRFDVTKKPGRTFVVTVGHVRVVVVGTTFTVTHVPDGVEVVVHEGHVRLEGGKGFAPPMTELSAGQRAWIPAPRAEASAPDAPILEPKVTIARPSVDAPVPPERDTGPSSAEVPPTRHPTTAPAPAPPSAGAAGNAVPVTAEALYAAAETARAAGRADEAIAHLEQVSRDFPADEHASLAAFGAGRLHANAGRSREAAVAFARARALAPDGPLAPDALLREALAWRAAEEDALSRQRAKEYLEAWPDGERAAEARALLGGR